MRLSRPCYDKPHRCPGWIGGGMKYATVEGCEGGRIEGCYDWKGWKPGHCKTCGVITIPVSLTRLFPSRLWYRLRSAVREVQYRRALAAVQSSSRVDEKDDA